MFNNRASGILLPIFSLPGMEGIGTLGQEAYKFVDFLSLSQQSYWQILPIGLTSYGDSPYQSYSSFAGNPYFIDLFQLAERGWLNHEELANTDWGSPDRIDYEKVWHHKYYFLRKAFAESGFNNHDIQICCSHHEWLEDFALFMALKHYFDGKPRSQWPMLRVKADIPDNLRVAIDSEYRFQIFLQSIFFHQWNELKSYAYAKEISIIGDLPIFTSDDSADVWASPEVFQLNADGNLSAVAGVPPDAFSETGQLWGNPLYDWQFLKHTEFEWWIRRMQETQKLFDVIRIDHFRAFSDYWSIPPDAMEASSGKWISGPGISFFETLKHKVKDLHIIAEDLGIITEDVRELLHNTGFPGMKVLLFAFDGGNDNPYLPHNIVENSVVYTGTHDNETTVGWYCNPEHKHEAANACKYLNIHHGSPEHFAEKLVETAMHSKANLVIIPIQDYLGLDNSARINQPSTVGCNWQWRMTSIPGQHTQHKIAELTARTARI
ncbi:MAG: 4-alpha-glucanotransferase [Brevinemataceae bacterium]